MNPSTPTLLELLRSVGTITVVLGATAGLVMAVISRRGSRSVRHRASAD